MQIKILGFLAAVSLVAACESFSQSAGSAGADATMMGDASNQSEVKVFSPRILQAKITWISRLVTRCISTLTSIISALIMHRFWKRKPNG